MGNNSNITNTGHAVLESVPEHRDEDLKLTSLDPPGTCIEIYPKQTSVYVVATYYLFACYLSATFSVTFL